MKLAIAACVGSIVAAGAIETSRIACKGSRQECAASIAQEIVRKSKDCSSQHPGDRVEYEVCTAHFCAQSCGQGNSCREVCVGHASSLFGRFTDSHSLLQEQAKEAATEQKEAMQDLRNAQGRLVLLSTKIQARAEHEVQSGDALKGRAELEKLHKLSMLQEQINEHLQKVETFEGMAEHSRDGASEPAPSFLQVRRQQRGGAAQKAPEDELAKEMTHDLEMNFNKIAPFGKEDTAKELQDHAAKTQDTLVDAVENAEVAEIKRAVFRALTRLRAATIKEFDTIARLETQAIDAYNDAHHYRAENPLAHLHEDEAPVETDKLKSFH
mmetsp:Transcript_94003/g.304136  ORF Transcript_94003/g.304136 Transcript_94003/m.304136 type:complete len:326 (+) Transcript_94003:74-1051(+)|eukprot:CAMPEP_0203966846 /NCGR_PEP_ID=MMETSP0359-20131031/95963_1 /ASSEMBLY_ACC=CAM_ASM_000338 /TAXON_ID=268821 /ORGANISM="Scrippsiella Hangoei, Strain SHTV-5" /LENGTH=325 /DNA_ID=CAMNT_0050904401 /DNA_START=74 /DNA_END=1051 /DNA_ORIENTATION=-